MSEYSEVESPFLQQLAVQGWALVEKGCATILQDTALREWFLPGVFSGALPAAAS